MGMCGTFSRRLASVVCICEYAITVVGICGQVVGMLGTGALLKAGFLDSPRSVARSSSDVDRLTTVTTSNDYVDAAGPFRCHHSQPESHPHYMDLI